MKIMGFFVENLHKLSEGGSDASKLCYFLRI